MDDKHPNSGIRAAVVISSDIVRAGARALLEEQDGLTVCFCSGRPGTGLLEVAIDVVLLDLEVADFSPSERLTELRKYLPTPKVVGLYRWFRADIGSLISIGGVSSAVSVWGPQSSLAEALKSAARSIDRHTAPSPSALGGVPASRLTVREQEVLELVASGLPNKSIASVLQISVGTVKQHTSSIFQKLGVSSRVHAALLARRLGYLL